MFTTLATAATTTTTLEPHSYGPIPPRLLLFRKSPTYSALLPEHVLLVSPPRHPPLPRTAKGNIQRQVTQRRFEGQLLRWFRGTPGTETLVVDAGAPDFQVGWLSSPLLHESLAIVGVTIDSLQSAPCTPQTSSHSSVVFAHFYVFSMALVLLHHMPKLREGCTHCGVFFNALETLGEAVAMPAFCVLAGVRDRQLASAAAMWKVTAHTTLLLGGCLYLAYFSSMPDKVSMHRLPTRVSQAPMSRHRGTEIGRLA